MKIILFASFLFLLLACNSTKNQQASEDKTTGDYLLRANMVNTLVDANHQKLKGINGNFNSFKTYLNSLSDSIVSIPYALDYINTCLSKDTANQDSVFLLFNTKFYSVTNNLSDSLDSKYSFLLEQIDKDSVTAELTAFKSNLTACGIDILTTEGMYYLDVIPDFFYKNFKNRVSQSLREYLNIRKDELKEGFSEDAGLLISFDDLYKRVKRWEAYINKYPQSIYIQDANSYYTTYLETLMTGMDNTSAFDYGENESVLNAEVKSLYEKIMEEDTESPTTKIITSYYNFLARHDFKQNDSIQNFLEANKLNGMLGVQPDTR
jgi:hypothetical protein